MSADQTNNQTATLIVELLYLFIYLFCFVDKENTNSGKCRDKHMWYGIYNLFITSCYYLKE